MLNIAAISKPAGVWEQRAWYSYDFGNSAFSSTVVTLFLGPYLTSLAKAAAGPDGDIHPFGISVDPRALWSYLIALSVVLQVLFLPLVGALADYGSRKREMLGALAIAGATATALMFFLEGDNYLFGAALFLLSNLAFGASIVIYNSFLPEIAAPDERDSVSSKGWGIGYLGGGLLLALNLYLFGNAKDFGISEGMAVRISLCSAGLWWGIFTVPALLGLKNRNIGHTLPPGENYLGVGLRQVKKLLREITGYRQALLFLIAFLLYNDGIQTVIALASQFGSDQLQMSMASLTQAILMVQFVAFFGAMGFNYLSKWLGAKRSIAVSLVIWTLTLFYIWLSVKTEREFFILAFIIGIVMGGSQALSRSLFSQLIPKGREAEYFSLYEISDKGTSWISPLVFGLALQWTGNYRVAILSLILFFIGGLIVLMRVQVNEGMREAGNA
ncbi:MFS transporter [Bryobacter aggregatus]|uniref:MFS transporter n=1 Tax=Bryobacter aggregatus TaxID=360054 RepID=UPI001EE2B9DA|nr:MFS transporter [Bryobacter aggregatus]